MKLTKVVLGVRRVRGARGKMIVFGVHHGKNEFARGDARINGIESFWGYAKNRLVNFKGVNKSMFIHSLKSANLELIIAR